MKTYFNYNQVIASKDVCESISMIKGAGPIIGFGSATIDSIDNKLIVKSLPLEVDPLYNIMKGKRDQWRIYKGNESTERDQTNFVGITRDGYVFGTDDENIEIPIQGSKGTYNEVILFAYHTPVTEPIENPVTFIAFWSEGVDSFYELYQKSLDPYYPSTPNNRQISFNNTDGISVDISYNNLLSKVENSCNYYRNNSNSLVLIGIYGTGNNIVDNTSNEPFALVPYNGDFPNGMGYTTAIHNSIKQSLNRLENIVEPSINTSLTQLLRSLKDEILNSIRKELTLATLPVGSIILWQGLTIPEGWAEFTEASGRIVIGYQPGGIVVPSDIVGTETKVVLSSIGSLYNPPVDDYNNPLNARYIPKHKHGVGTERGRQSGDSDVDKSILEGWDNRNKSLNGGVGGPNHGYTYNIQNGGVSTSPNFIDQDTQREQTYEQWNAIKLPKAITLKYIIKIS